MTHGADTGPLTASTALRKYPDSVDRRFGHARHYEGHIVLFVVHSINVDRSDPSVPKPSGGTVRLVDPLGLAAGTLRETAYTWALAKPQRRSSTTD